MADLYDSCSSSQQLCQQSPEFFQMWWPLVFQSVENVRINLGKPSSYCSLHILFSPMILYPITIILATSCNNPHAIDSSPHCAHNQTSSFVIVLLLSTSILANISCHGGHDDSICQGVEIRYKSKILLKPMKFPCKIDTRSSRLLQFRSDLVWNHGWFSRSRCFCSVRSGFCRFCICGFCSFHLWLYGSVLSLSGLRRCPEGYPKNGNFDMEHAGK